MDTPDKTLELKKIVNEKNDIISNQSKRISLLEEKLDEVRQKYFHLKRMTSLLVSGKKLKSPLT
jgi:hypothetical protein